MPGRMVIFPAWLSHSVAANVRAEERVSIRFNIMFERYTETMSGTLWETDRGAYGRRAPARRGVR